MNAQEAHSNLVVQQSNLAEQKRIQAEKDQAEFDLWKEQHAPAIINRERQKINEAINETINSSYPSNQRGVSLNAYNDRDNYITEQVVKSLQNDGFFVKTNYEEEYDREMGITFRSNEVKVSW